MKKRLFALASMFLLFSCNDSTNDTAINDGDNDHMATASRYSENNREVYRAIETGDMSKLDMFYCQRYN